jgi:alkylation response protein AidB-like acyl-CoA dehydrogenase
VTEPSLDTIPPLTQLTEDETIFRDSVAEFADAQVRPLSREMDEHAKMPRTLVDALFSLGVMGIEVPDAYGGAGGRFFHSVLAVEALSRVDASVGLIVDVQNTLVCNAFLRWGNDAQKATYLPRLASASIGEAAELERQMEVFKRLVIEHVETEIKAALARRKGAAGAAVVEVGGGK